MNLRTIFWSKAIEEEVQRRVWEEQRRREEYERFERIERRCAELEMQMYDLRMKADPEFRRRNTPVCNPAENVVYTESAPTVNAV